MTATDSSHLEPDMHDSEALATQHASAVRDGMESPAPTTESAQPTRRAWPRALGLAEFAPDWHGISDGR